MNNVTVNYPPNACAYIAMEQLLGKEINDQKWLDHIRSNRATNTLYLRDIICPIYQCTYIPYFIYYMDMKLKYNRLLTEHGIYWFKNNENIIITHYKDKRKKVNCHTLTAPIYTLCSIDRIHSLIIRNNSYVELDNSSAAIEEYNNMKGKSK